MRGTLSKAVMELDDLFRKLLSEANDFNFQTLDDPKKPFGSNYSKLQILGAALSDSLEQIGPVTGFLKIYSDSRSERIVKELNSHYLTAKEQDFKMGVSKDIYERGTSVLIPYAQILLNMLNVNRH